MSASFSTLITGIISVSLLHALVPHHWLPFVIVGRQRGWNSRKTMSVLLLGALAHTLSTVAVGLAVSYLGHQLDQKLHSIHGIFPGMILFAFGSGFFISGHRHNRHALSDRIAASSLVFMLALSPCLVVAPFFLILGPMGLAAVLKVSAVMSFLSIAGMAVLGWLALKGLDTYRLNWLERNEPQIMGSLLMLLGVTFILI